MLPIFSSIIFDFDDIQNRKIFFIIWFHPPVMIARGAGWDLVKSGWDLGEILYVCGAGISYVQSWWDHMMIFWWDLRLNLWDLGKSLVRSWWDRGEMWHSCSVSVGEISCLILLRSWWYFDEILISEIIDKSSWDSGEIFVRFWWGLRFSYRYLDLFIYGLKFCYLIVWLSYWTLAHKKLYVIIILLLLDLACLYGKVLVRS